MDINDKIIQENYKMFVKAAKESKKENIIKTKERKKGFEKFCNTLSYMTNEELMTWLPENCCIQSYEKW